MCMSARVMLTINLLIILSRSHFQESKNNLTFVSKHLNLRTIVNLDTLKQVVVMCRNVIFIHETLPAFFMYFAVLIGFCHFLLDISALPSEPCHVHTSVRQVGGISILDFLLFLAPEISIQNSLIGFATCSKLLVTCSVLHVHSLIPYCICIVTWFHQESYLIL